LFHIILCNNLNIGCRKIFDYFRWQRDDEKYDKRQVIPILFEQSPFLRIEIPRNSRDHPPSRISQRQFTLEFPHSNFTCGVTSWSTTAKFYSSFGINFRIDRNNVILFLHCNDRMSVNRNFIIGDMNFQRKWT